MSLIHSMSVQKRETGTLAHIPAACTLLTLKAVEHNLKH